MAGDAWDVRGQRRYRNPQGGRGRMGDTMTGHLTPGEKVIPPEVLAQPGMRPALSMAFRAAGLPEGRYTVGGADDSRNPRTGMREFFGVGPGGPGADSSAADAPGAGGGDHAGGGGSDPSHEGRDTGRGGRSFEQAIARDNRARAAAAQARQQELARKAAEARAREAARRAAVAREKANREHANVINAMVEQTDFFSRNREAIESQREAIQEARDKKAKEAEDRHFVADLIGAVGTMVNPIAGVLGLASRAAEFAETLGMPDMPQTAAESLVDAAKQSGSLADLSDPSYTGLGPGPSTPSTPGSPTAPSPTASPTEQPTRSRVGSSPTRTPAAGPEGGDGPSPTRTARTSGVAPAPAPAAAPSADNPLAALGIGPDSAMWKPHALAADTSWLASTNQAIAKAARITGQTLRKPKASPAGRATVAPAQGGGGFALPGRGGVTPRPVPLPFYG